jgi:hypothetical protein
MSHASENPSRFPLGRENVLRDAKGQARARRRSVRPGVDVLEERTTPSTFLVTNTLDPAGRLVPGSLRWAIAQANVSRSQIPTVEITSKVQGPITLHAGELRVSNGMTIENGSGAPLTIQQSTPNSRVFHVLANPRTNLVTISGESGSTPLTVTGGRVVNANGGGILVDNPQNVLTLQDVDVVGNSASQVTRPTLGAKGNGGGIYSSGSVSLVESNVSFNSAIGLNSASGHAGGVYADRGITMDTSHVDSNSARDAGGILNVFGSVEVTNQSTVDNNTSSGHALPMGDLGGGGISEMDGNVIIAGSQVNNNRTIGMYSGGIVLLLGGVTVTDLSQVDGNTNNGPGGGIAANFGGPVTVMNGSQVNGNTSGGVGGGIVNWSTNFGINIIDDSEVNNNLATNAEDAKSAAGLGLLFTDHSITNAFVSGGRGDAQLKQALQLFVNACGQRLDAINTSIAAFPSGGNVEIGAGIASVFGGPIEVLGGSSISGNLFGTVPTSTLPNNGIGGGVFSTIGQITIDGSTISDNSASGDGGGIWNGLALAITNSTVTGNHSAGHGGGIFNRGAYTHSNDNISGNTPDDVFPTITPSNGE